MLRHALVLVFLVSGCASTATVPAPPASSQTDTPHSAPMMDRTETTMPHYVTTKSHNNFADTLSKLQAAIDARGFKTFAVVDHAKGAASVGQALRPTTLVIFGNPKGGTPLMQAAQTFGFDLPLKALVYEDADGTVTIATTDITGAMSRQGVTGLGPLREKVSGALTAIASEAATP